VQLQEQKVQRHETLGSGQSRSLAGEAISQYEGEQVMGNRDTRGREKKKPKKKEIKQKGAPARPAPVYKPAPPAAPQPPNPGSGAGS
jgi:hypothetical protein